MVVSLPVSTPESPEAYAKRIAAGERLAQVTRELTEANATMYTSGKARRRYEELQKEWEQAFHDFQVATREFTVTTKTNCIDVECP